MKRIAPDPDELLAGVRLLDADALVEFLDELGGLQCVADADRQIRRRRIGRERYPARNAEIRRRQQQGETLGQLALVFGLKRSTIGDIVRRSRKKVYVPNECVHLGSR